MHNEFEVKHLRLEHFFANAKKTEDLEILKKIREYLNENVNIVVKSSTFLEKNKSIYLFEFQNEMSLGDLTVLLQEMFNNDEWTICYANHNLTTKQLTVETL